MTDEFGEGESTDLYDDHSSLDEIAEEIAGGNRHDSDDLIEAFDRTSDGWIFDKETGEIVGRQEVAFGFRIDDRNKADWALELRARIEAEIAAIDLREQALVANLRAQRRIQERRLAWWDWRLKPDLIQWARQELGSGKSRTLRLDWGSVSARVHPETYEIGDPNAAVQFVEAWAPNLVKHQKSVGIKAVLAAREAVEEACKFEEPVSLPFLITKPGGDKWTVKTGIMLREREVVDDGDGTEE